ncbi:hypothetical protein, partial [Vibrio sp. 10N.222.52.B12]|uniref:hypothetical protein n=1 Tax=Vibrio sp. 10N.222.52.B12 TaxID=1880840 RepID=UPI001055E1AF
MPEEKPSFVFAIGNEATGIIKYKHVSIMLKHSKEVVATFSIHSLQFENEPVNPEGQVSLFDKDGSCTGSFFLGTDNSDFADLKIFSDMHGLTNSGLCCVNR